MDLSRGCVLIARSLDESDIFQNEKWLKVWVWCVIQANHKGKNVPVNIGRSKTSVWVDRGQFIFGRNKAAEKLGMKPSTVRNIMDKLDDLGNLDIKPDNHFSIVTLSDFDFYQNMNNYKGQAEGQPEDRQRTTRGQPEDTTNTPKQPNNENKTYSEDSKEFRLSLFLLNNIRKRKPDYKIPNLQKWSVQSDYILRIDKRDPHEIKKVIEWCQKDEFWQDNILSTAKLRKQYDKLVMKMNKENTPKINNEPVIRNTFED